MAKKRKPVSREPAADRSRPDLVAQIEESSKYPFVYAGAILVFTVVLFHKFIFSDQMLLGSDTIQAGVFFRDFLVNHFKDHGSIPMWNPYIFCGMPFVDAFHGDIFYLPTFIIKMIMPLERALGWGLVVHVYLAGIFAYLCARGFGLSRLASTFAGITYMFSSYLISMVAPGHDGKMFVTALFPLAFHFLNRGLTTSRLKHFILLGLTITLIILTPHPQMAYFTLWALGGFLVYRVIFMFKDRVAVSKIALVTAMFVLAVVIGLFGSAIQFYPGYRYISEFSPRAGDGAEGRSGYDWAISWSLHSEELVGQFIPGFAGVDNQAAGTQYWGRNAFKDNSEYSGVFAILLGIIGIALARKRETWFLLGLGAFALIYALGGTTPIFYLFYYIIPNVSKMRAPSMIMFLFSFSFAILAAYGIDALTRLRTRGSGATRAKLERVLLIAAAIVSVTTLLFTVAGSALMSIYTSIVYSSISANNQTALDGHLAGITVSLWVVTILLWVTVLLLRSYVRASIGRTALVLLAFISLIDLWRLDFTFIDVVDYNSYFADAPVLQNLKSSAEPVRVFDLSKRTFASRDYFALKGVEQMTGYHGAQLKSFDEFIGGLAYTRLTNQFGIELRAFHLTGTKYIVLDRGRKMNESTGLKKVYENEVTVYETPAAMRRVSIFHAYQMGKGDTTDLDLLYDENFHYQSILILYEKPEFPPTLNVSGEPETVEIVEHDVNRQVYRARLATPGLLFVSENYFPGWKVKVDGVEKKLLKADHTFRAVSLDAGDHEVEFYFDWDRYDNSKLVTWVTVVASLLLLGVCLVIERRKGDSKVE